MSIHTFHEEFTSDLESFVKNPVQIEPLAGWNPRKPAAPERHIMHGYTANIAIDAIIHMLETQNSAFDNIQSMLRIYLNPIVLRNNARSVVSPVKEQVWLFAYKWFSTYFALLTEPNILRSEFYKRDHDRFLTLMGGMLHIDCQKRISFIEAITRWVPERAASVCERYVVPIRTDTYESKSDDDVVVCASAAVAIDDPSKILPPVSSPPLSVHVAEVEKPLPPLPQQPRLALSGLLYLAGRNKTRKNHRS